MRREVLVGTAAITVAAALGAACRLTEGLTGGPIDDAGMEAAATDDAGSSCSADLLHSVENCGACGHACPSGPNGVATCVDGGCNLLCTPSFADCDDGGANGCETNVNTSRTSCGRCGHDCMGGNCTGGACQPVTMASTTNTPVHIVTDDTYLYGINAFGTVTRFPLDGGQLVQLVEGDTTAQSPPPRIAIANGSLYYTSLGDGGLPDGAPGGTVSTLPLDGGKASVLAVADEPYAIATTSAFVYWSQGAPSGSAPSASVVRCKVSGCASTVETLAPTENGRIFSMIADNQSVTWANAGTPPNMSDGAVKRCAPPSPGCTPTIIAGPPKAPTGPYALAADKTTIFWTTFSGSVASCLAGGCSNIPTLLDTFQFGPRFLAVDGQSAFWTNADGTVKATAKNGSGSERTLYLSRGSSPWDIVVEPYAIYWTDPSAPALYRLAR